MRHIAHKHQLMLVISQKAETSSVPFRRRWKSVDDLFDFQGQQADSPAAGQPRGQLQDPHDCLHFSQRQVVFLLIHKYSVGSIIFSTVLTWWILEI